MNQIVSIEIKEISELANSAKSLSISDADGLASLARQLDEISRRLKSATASVEQKDSVLSLAALIRLILKNRRLRSQFFSNDIFADPAWDMLLDLTLARLEGRHISVSSLCVAANVPTTTALRWIKQLIERGLIDRKSDPGDARRSFVEIEDAPFNQMIYYLTKISRFTKSNEQYQILPVVI